MEDGRPTQAWSTPRTVPASSGPRTWALWTARASISTGPSRAAGVPAVAGLILYDEVMAGEIRHKIAAASRFCAYKEFVFPAAWTDGIVEGGIPEGTLIQLDPNLDLSRFPLTPEERIVCVALQRYGMVLVDIAQGQPVYAEGLWGHPGKSWKGKLRLDRRVINDSLQVLPHAQDGARDPHGRRALQVLAGLGRSSDKIGPGPRWRGEACHRAPIEGPYGPDPALRALSLHESSTLFPSSNLP